MNNTLKGKDLLATNDWAKSELDQVLDLAFKFKQMGAKSRSFDILKGKTLLLLWFLGSTRTWNSFHGAMEQLGGFVRSREAKDMWVALGKGGPGTKESLKDTALVLDRYIDALGIRLVNLTPEQTEERIPKWGDAQAIMQRFADYMEAPVINMCSDMHHPTQSLADMMVMREKLGDVRGKKAVLMWAYNPKATGYSSAHGFAIISATYGMDVTIAHPDGYDLDQSVVTFVQKECYKNGRECVISHDLKSALDGADAVYPRNWRIRAYLDEEGREAEERIALQHKDWRLSESLMKVTRNARFLHSMPFFRGYEVDASVADGPNSIIYDQAESLIHVRKAVLALLLADGDELGGVLS